MSTYAQKLVKTFETNLNRYDLPNGKILVTFNPWKPQYDSDGDPLIPWGEGFARFDNDTDANPMYCGVTSVWLIAALELVTAVSV